MLSIRLLGAPLINVDGQPLGALRRKNRALVFYLAAQGEPLAREKLLTFFWPDHPRPAAQPILRSMIHDLRKQLGKCFQADDESIGLSSNTFIDVQEFAAALAAPASNLQRLAEVLNFYQGDFLDGFTLSDSPQFDDWAAAERERYQRLAIDGWTRLSQRHEAQRAYPAAVEALRRALAFNPLQEDFQRALMRLLYLNGDRAGFIRQYETLRKLLDEELGALPMPETRALYDSLINDTFVPVASETTGHLPTTKPSADKPLLPLLGRDVELETLKGHLGSGKLILLEGEPGIGKTRLISEFIASQTQGKTSVFVLRL
jgi:DNA-binding SARP family transcriptional activator